jgi:hypothetical protein
LDNQLILQNKYILEPATTENIPTASVKRADNSNNIRKITKIPLFGYKKTQNPIMVTKKAKTEDAIINAEVACQGSFFLNSGLAYLYTIPPNITKIVVVACIKKYSY